jgi:shikimate dehydrogenase
MMNRACGARDGKLRSGDRVASRHQARLFGVLGDPVDHSLSPAMHNAAFAAAGLPHVYLRYRVPAVALPAAMREAKALRMGGLNLTVPLKEAVLPLLDAITREAERAGAVNTIVFSRDGRTLGDNTDGEGFLRALRGRIGFRGARAVIIGAGGSARAVGAALCRAGCAAIIVANRTVARGERLAERLARLGGAAIRVVPLAALARGDVLESAALVVNATPLGLAGARLRVRYAAAPGRCLFVDLVYAPRPTPFLAGARRAGRPTLDGAHMLLHQGALAFEAWTGQRAPRDAMARALRAAGLALTEPTRAARVAARRPPTR